MSIDMAKWPRRIKKRITGLRATSWPPRLRQAQPRFCQSGDCLATLHWIAESLHDLLVVTHAQYIDAAQLAQHKN